MSGRILPLETSTLFLIFSVEWKENDEVALDLELETDTMKYRSVKHSGKPPEKYFRTFLAIRNKTTGKTRLVEANETVLAPVIQYPKSTNPLLNGGPEEHVKKNVEEVVEASKHLTKSFGQSKGSK